MANLKEWIEEEAWGEEIEGVVVGEMGWGSYGSDGVPGYDKFPQNVIVPWAEAKDYLSYEFDDGFGAPGCQAVTAWTKSWVISVSQYDGSTGPFKLPRNPVDHKPEMPGG